MKRALVAGLLTTLALLSTSTRAQTALGEGRVPESKPTSPATDRVSAYRSGRSETGMPASTEKKSASSAAKASAAAKKTHRAIDAKLSARSSYFYIYDAGRSLFADRDLDGYHSEFRIRFDADATFGDARVYAKLYIRRVGTSDSWQLYRETDDFWIYGQSGSDDYYVDTVLDDGFPTAEYDVLIDLYESGYSGIVATLGPSNDAALSYLPLEEVGLDLPFGLSGYRINDVATSLLIDSDRDGFHSRFDITFDPDTDFGSAWVYAVVWVRAAGGEWIEEHVSDDFIVDASGTADVYSITADWISGYPTGRYDVQIDLHDPATSLLVTSAGSERIELSRLPLEDQSLDRAPNGPNPGSGGGASTSYEHGGGSMTLAWVGALLMLGMYRSLRRRSGRQVEIESRETDKRL